jgi:hypothetical protein
LAFDQEERRFERTTMKRGKEKYKRRGKEEKERKKKERKR